MLKQKDVEYLMAAFGLLLILLEYLHGKDVQTILLFLVAAVVALIALIVWFKWPSNHE